RMERVRSWRIAARIRAMPHPLKGDGPLGSRGLERRTNRAGGAGPAEVAWILQLHDDAVGIAKGELGRAFLCTAVLGATKPDVRLHRTSAVRFRNPVVGENLQDLVHVEALNAQTEVIDP